ncbi:serine/threonine-protein kinase [Streptomyces antimicrobicus]|uniref:non-specific serine/threonine protein kinase n=1 Tax=Streptomyces antimicrobicus TaxID=2883108 RepID=A0ABS8B807_9ACTN|nr:serine/threonine-protein kinase [Streptomyces antimicrobicus]MCB5180737.1 serine/threonine protein kinase [Streptomyces antimicrobicus]
MHSGELVAGRYALVERLGRGGMGEVWAARDRSLHRDVAVKVLALDRDAVPELAQRFEREAVAAARITHPNVAAMYDRGTHEDVLFLVMEKVDGRPLSERLRSGAPLPLGEALALAEGICTALVAAHRAGVVHYDIKPHNVMLTRDHEVKVVDFGIAGFLQTAFTAVARSSQLSPAGTAEYGAPEQFLSARGDERSDLYALGSVLFTLLTGRPPFSGHHPLAVIRRKLDEDAPRLDTVRPGLPPALTGLVAALLDRDPARRPATAREVRDRIQALRGLRAPADAHDTGSEDTRAEDADAHGPGSADARAEGDTHADAAPDAAAERRALLSRLAGAARRVVAHGATRPLHRPPAPARRAAAGFDVVWTGEEPLASYARGPALRKNWLRSLLLSAAAAASFYVPFRTGLVGSGPDGDIDGAWPLLFTLAGLLGLAGLAGVGGAVTDTVKALRDASFRVQGSPWRLEVGPTGITVGGAADRNHFAWDTVRRVVVEEVQGPSQLRFSGLHLDLVPGVPASAAVRPAGWPYADPRAPVARPTGRLPVCVLGPLTSRQRKELLDALAAHGGQRWVPASDFVIPPPTP